MPDPDPIHPWCGRPRSEHPRWDGTPCPFPAVEWQTKIELSGNPLVASVPAGNNTVRPHPEENPVYVVTLTVRTPSPEVAREDARTLSAAMVDLISEGADDIDLRVSLWEDEEGKPETILGEVKEEGVARVSPGTKLFVVGPDREYEVTALGTADERGTAELMLRALGEEPGGYQPDLFD